MSGPLDGEVAYRRPRRGDHLSVAVWMAPGRAEYVAAARRWAQAVAAAWDASASDIGLVVSELVTNALRHTRSGRPGGTVVVAVAGGWDCVTVHVHDLGADGGQVPRPRQAAHDADGGRGLAIVIAVSAEWGIIPAAWCPVQRANAPTADAGGAAPGAAWCPGRSRTERRAGMPDGGVFAEQLYAHHGRGLMRLAVRLTGGDWQHAEDLAQEAMLRAWRHRDVIRPGQERAWLTATARHLAIDGYRREQARHAREARHASLAIPADDLAGRVAETVTVRAAIAALPPIRRAVIAELYYAGRTIAETAAVLGIPPGTVKSRASHALAALRPALTAATRTDGTEPGERAVR